MSDNYSSSSSTKPISNGWKHQLRWLVEAWSLFSKINFFVYNIKHNPSPEKEMARKAASDLDFQLRHLARHARENIDTSESLLKRKAELKKSISSVVDKEEEGFFKNINNI
jgi:hypothetical protein